MDKSTPKLTPKLTPNASFSIALSIELPCPEAQSTVLDAIAAVGGVLETTPENPSDSSLPQQEWQQELIVDAYSADHAQEVIEAVRSIPGVQVIDAYDRTFALHHGGKIALQSRIPLAVQSDLAMAYTPGVGRICTAIAQDKSKVYSLTAKGNLVAVVTDGSAVLGLGNLGPEAALPVMEGKALLFKKFAGIDAFPLCLDTQDTEEIIATVKRIAPVFGGINLEDIAAPRCFEIEARLRKELDIPVFHDDQHGTAIVSLAALINALKVVQKSLAEVRIVINGAGAAGIAIASLLRKAGATQLLLCDSKGIISKKRPGLTPEKQNIAVEEAGTLADALKGADVFLGVSAPNVVTREMVASMASQPIVFAMANPIPEIQPELITDIVGVVATGRSDYPNQINNVLAFPGIFRGVLDSRAPDITEEMHLEAAKAIASLVNPATLDRDHIIPSVFDDRVADAVANAVKSAVP